MAGPDGRRPHQHRDHLSPYNGTLTLLDNKRDGDDRAPRRQPAPAGAGAGGGGGPASDEDSDIPF
jgi:hypothetical protein